MSIGHKGKRKSNIKLDISDDIKDYHCWRNFNKLEDDTNYMNMLKPKGDFEISPKTMVDVFGLPNFTDNTFDKNLGIFYF